MPDGFFSSNKKRKRSDSAGSTSLKSRKLGRITTNGRPSKTKRKKDEELDSDSDEKGGIDDVELRVSDVEESDDDEYKNETPAERRLRLAKSYLDSIKHDLVEGEYDAADIDKELISARLRKDVLDHAGKVHLFIADSLAPSPKPIFKRGHQLTVTCATVSESCQTMFTSGKEGSIIQWDLKTGQKRTSFRKQRNDSKGKKKVDQVEGHTDQVWTLAVSYDGKYLASGGRDRKIGVWDAEKGEWVRGLTGHKDAITALAFRKGTHQLYSASDDRTVKLFSLSPTSMGYIETLFGHQDCITALDTLRGETAVSSGGRDKTVRYWKIPDETQLVFRGGASSSTGEDGAKLVEGRIDCVAMIDETTFVTGGDTGSICLWNTGKKKPLFTKPLAHGFHEHLSETEGLLQTPRWITAIAGLAYSDLIASGSWEGCIRLWKIDPTLKSFQALQVVVPATGIVNSLQLLAVPKGNLEWMQEEQAPALLVAGLGQEPRTGRWMQIKTAKNGALVIPLIKK